MPTTAKPALTPPAEKPQHTPGPWRINPATDAKHEIIADGEHMVICRTSSELYMRRATANARLIAAAPDLLEVLRDLTDAIDRASNWNGDMRRRINAARAVIAKAEGRQ